jgi:hypothetical protein
MDGKKKRNQHNCCPKHDAYGWRKENRNSSFGEGTVDGQIKLGQK